MVVIDGRTWSEHLRPAVCWSLLAGERIGRLGVLVDSAPEIYPVNFAVDDETIVFRTDPGSKLRGLVRSPSVCPPAHSTAAAMGTDQITRWARTSIAGMPPSACM